jgi:hypothetical protein
MVTGAIKAAYLEELRFAKRQQWAITALSPKLGPLPLPFARFVCFEAPQPLWSNLERASVA